MQSKAQQARIQQNAGAGERDAGTCGDGTAQRWAEQHGDGDTKACTGVLNTHRSRASNTRADSKVVRGSEAHWKRGGVNADRRRRSDGRGRAGT